MSSEAGYGRSSNHSCTRCQDNPLLLLLFVAVAFLIIGLLLYLVVKTIKSFGKVQANGVLRVRAEYEQRSKGHGCE